LSNKLFLDYDQKALDDQYEQRVWVPNADEILKRCARASEEVRKRIGEPRTERYGPAPIEQLEIYGEGDKAFVFVHGGAWKRQSARENAFAAEAIMRAGAAYVALDFAPLPSITLPEMVRQVCSGVAWVHRNLTSRIVLCGHSSGAHLAACALIRTGLAQAALLVSGIYDLLPVRLSARNEYVRLDEKLEHEFSPIRHIEKIRCPVSVAWGEHEAAEFERQSREFAQKLGAPTIIGRGLNHFELIETLADPASALARAAYNFLR
jgi:arylformamidase